MDDTSGTLRPLAPGEFLLGDRSRPQNDRRQSRQPRFPDDTSVGSRTSCRRLRALFALSDEQIRREPSRCCDRPPPTRVRAARFFSLEIQLSTVRRRFLRDRCIPRICAASLIFAPLHKANDAAAAFNKILDHPGVDAKIRFGATAQASRLARALDDVRGMRGKAKAAYQGPARAVEGPDSRSGRAETWRRRNFAAHSDNETVPRRDGAADDVRHYSDEKIV